MENDLKYFAGKETHDALVKQTKKNTIKGCIKYLEENGYYVAKKTGSSTVKVNITKDLKDFLNKNRKLIIELSK